MTFIVDILICQLLPICLRFGVCCVFMVTACGSTISQNCSYIKNPGYPNAYTDTTACSYTISKCDCCKNDFQYFIARK